MSASDRERDRYSATDNTMPLQLAGFRQKMVDAVATYESATATADIDALAGLFAEDCALVSPLSGRMVIRGRRDLKILAGAIYNQLHNLRWVDRWIGDSSVVIRAESRIGPFRLDDLMVLEFDADARIRRVRPHLRPLLASIYLLVVLTPRMARHPALIRRALRGEVLTHRS